MRNKCELQSVQMRCSSCAHYMVQENLSVTSLSAKDQFMLFENRPTIKLHKAIQISACLQNFSSGIK